MSRIGKKPVPVPKGVTVSVDGSTVKVKGPRGELHARGAPRHAGLGRWRRRSSSPVHRTSRSHKALHGLTRTLVANMVEGVTAGFRKQLEIVGVGYKAEGRPFGLQLALGFSHPVDYRAPAGIKLTAPQPTSIVIEGCEQGSGRPGGRRASQPASARAVQGQGHQVRRRAGPPEGGQDGSEVMGRIGIPKTRDAEARAPAPSRTQEGDGHAGAPAARGVPLAKHITAQLVDDVGAADADDGHAASR